MLHTAEDLGSFGYDNSYGHGLVNVKAALEFRINIFVEINLTTDKFPEDNTVTLTRSDGSAVFTLDDLDACQASVQCTSSSILSARMTATPLPSLTEFAAGQAREAWR
jgi:hypothetical protein